MATFIPQGRPRDPFEFNVQPSLPPAPATAEQRHELFELMEAHVELDPRLSQDQASYFLGQAFKSSVEAERLRRQLTQEGGFFGPSAQ